MAIESISTKTGNAKPTLLTPLKPSKLVHGNTDI